MAWVNPPVNPSGRGLEILRFFGLGGLEVSAGRPLTGSAPSRLNPSRINVA